MERRIAVISEDLVEPWDEGIKKFAYSVGAALGRGNRVLMLNVDRSGLGQGDAAERMPASFTFANPRIRGALRAFDPDAVVYVASPSSTRWSFLRSFVLKLHTPRARVGMVALIPRRHGRLVRPFLRATAPDAVFVASYASLLHLHEIGVRGDVVPVGIDPDRHNARARDDGRAELRERYGVPPDAYVYLHVGHLRPRRNLAVLGALARQPGCAAVCVGSTSTPEDPAVRSALEESGVRIIREFVPVEELYRLADCYVFPVRDSEGCVEVPLSVLEALAGGLPVLARPFGGLRDFLPEGRDLRYWDSDEELLGAAESLRAEERPRTRDMSAFTWDAVANRIVARLSEEAQ